jgi:O-antigen ligase
MSQSRQKHQDSRQPKKTASVEIANSNLAFYALLGFIILFIPVFQVRTALDVTLFPRLTAVCTFLTLMTAYLSFKKEDWIKQAMPVLRNPIFLVLLFYWLTIIITMVFARQPAEGFFDLFKNLLFITAIAVVSVLFVSKPDWHAKLPWLVMIAAFIALSIGAKQYYEKVFLSTGEYLKDGRADIYAVEGIMSHKNEYSNSLMLMLPFLFYSIYRLKGGARALAFVITFCQLIMIMLLKTRAVWVGVVALGLVASIAIVLDYQRMGISRKWRNIIGGLVATGIATILVIYNLPKASDDFSIVGRIQGITDTQSWHNINRLKIWGATIELIKDHFWMGVGPGNWNMEYYTYVQGLFTGIQQTNWGRPHNDFLWVFAEKGIFGILLFISFFLFLFYLGIQVLRKSTDKNSRILAVLLMGGIAAYLCISFFSFPIERINHQLYLAITAAGIIALHHSVSDRSPSGSLSSFALVPLIPLLGFGAYYGTRAVDMEIHLKAARVARERKMYDVMQHEAKEAINPFRLLDNNSSTAQEFLASALYLQGKHKEALDIINQGMEIFPNHIVMLGRKGEILVALKRYKEAQEIFEKGLKLIPNSRELLYNRGVCYYYQGKYKESLESMSKIKRKRRGKEIKEKIKFLEKIVAEEERTGKKYPPPPNQ